LHEFSLSLLVSPENNGAMMPKWWTPSGLDAQSENISSFRVKYCGWWKNASIRLLGYWLSNR
jgi:hypothetical protein